VPEDLPVETQQKKNDEKRDDEKNSQILSRLLSAQCKNGSFNLSSDLLEGLCEYYEVDVIEALKEELPEDLKTDLGDTVEILLHTILVIRFIDRLQEIWQNRAWWKRLWSKSKLHRKPLKKAYGWLMNVVGDLDLRRSLHIRCGRFLKVETLT